MPKGNFFRKDGAPHNFNNVDDLMSAKLVCGKPLDEISTDKFLANKGSNILRLPRLPKTLSRCITSDLYLQKLKGNKKLTKACYTKPFAS